jgi:hypothetical protein
MACQRLLNQRLLRRPVEPALAEPASVEPELLSQHLLNQRSPSQRFLLEIVLGKQKAKHNSCSAIPDVRDGLRLGSHHTSTATGSSEERMAQPGATDT